MTSAADTQPHDHVFAGGPTSRSGWRLVACFSFISSFFLRFGWPPSEVAGKNF